MADHPGRVLVVDDNKVNRLLLARTLELQGHHVESAANGRLALARLNDEAATRHYISPKTGRVVGQYSSRGWMNRWLYHGLHSLDFPWLYNYRPLWDVVVLTFMVGGTLLCVTSLILAWRVLGRKLAVFSARPRTVLNEDLT